MITRPSSRFYFKSIFPSGLWTLDLVQVRMMTTQRKVLGHSKQMPSPGISGGTPLPTFPPLPFSGSGIETDSERQLSHQLDEAN